ncbi:MAG: transcriptional regulator [Calditrichaeota bacterium]|nr:transcriptional regulator [Calditrichota bacterium]
MRSPQYTREIPQRYRLEAGKCTNCGKVHFPPRLICDACRCREFEDITLPREGKVLTWTVIYVPPPRFDLEVPYVVAIVELESGVRQDAGQVRLTCQVVDCDPDELAVDLPVELVFRRIQEDSQADIIQYGYKAVLKRE